MTSKETWLDAQVSLCDNYLASIILVPSFLKKNSSTRPLHNEHETRKILHHVSFPLFFPPPAKVKTFF